MPCGPQLIEAVAAVIFDKGSGIPRTIQTALMMQDYGLPISSQPITTRAIRYAISELIKQGRAKRKGQQGPVYAVRAE